MLARFRPVGGAPAAACPAGCLCASRPAAGCLAAAAAAVCSRLRIPVVTDVFPKAVRNRDSIDCSRASLSAPAREAHLSQSRPSASLAHPRLEKVSIFGHLHLIMPHVRYDQSPRRGRQAGQCTSRALMLATAHLARRMHPRRVRRRHHGSAGAVPISPLEPSFAEGEAQDCGKPDHI